MGSATLGARSVDARDITDPRALRNELILGSMVDRTLLRLIYRSSFSLTVNHRDTFTGVVDNDRARTIAALGEAARDPDGTRFAEEFDTPGHVHLLKAAPDLLADRQGHTELGVALADLADVPPAVVVCEMLDDRTRGALSRSSAASYASDNDYVFLNGASVVERVRDS